MFCTKCGKAIEDNAKFCVHCGAQLAQPTVAEEVPAEPVVPVAPAEPVTPAEPVVAVPAEPVVAVPAEPAEPVTRVVKVLPEENKPLSPWGYFGLQILFAIPVVGFIFLIVFSFNGSNINRRNFARSYWCAVVIAVILVVVVAAVSYLASGGASYLFN